MQALIIYYSLSGNSAQAAQYVAKGLEAENVVVTTMNVTKAQIEDLNNKDIVVFGTPNHAGSPAMLLRKFLNSLSDTALAGKKVSTFATFLFWKGEVLTTIEEIAQDKGATNIVPGYARRTSFLLNLWSVITGSTEDEEAWIAFGKQISTS